MAFTPTTPLFEIVEPIIPPKMAFFMFITQTIPLMCSLLLLCLMTISTWTCGMIMALRVKNKDGFINSTI